MKPFNLGIGTLILRFYAMMGVVILGGFTGQYWLMVLALPIFLSAMMGVTMGRKKTTISSKDRNLQQKASQAQAA